MEIFVFLLAASVVIFIASLISLIFIENLEKRKTAKTWLLISVVVFIVGFGSCLSSI